ncbi:MAG TPA: HAMP domain-containing protein, partial [Bryobacteraceae bacterium]|nr:HAMP domain-containing protein [Bryobacteraceae bacterium]
MKKRLFYGFILLALIVGLLVIFWPWNPGRLRPETASETYVFWAVLSVIFLLIVTLTWILFREGVNLYEERHRDSVGSHIKTKLVFGAVALSVMPVCFLVFFGYGLMNRNLSAWFRDPTNKDLNAFKHVAELLDKEMTDETMAQVELLAAKGETHAALLDGPQASAYLEKFAQEQELRSVALYVPNQKTPVAAWGPWAEKAAPGLRVGAKYPIMDGAREIGRAEITADIPLDVESEKANIWDSWSQWQRTYELQKSFRTSYTLLMALVTVFVLFVAVWIALFVAKQISIPIGALLGAASEVSKGNLQHRVEVRASDELGDLVRAFNRMIEELDAGSRELDRRRRFTEAILESIPTGVISIGADGSIQRVNRALSQIFPADQAVRAQRLEDLFSREDTAEIKYMMKRARR